VSRALPAAGRGSEEAAAVLGPAGGDLPGEVVQRESRWPLFHVKHGTPDRGHQRPQPLMFHVKQTLESPKWA